MIITGDNAAEIKYLKDDLSIRFETKSLGQVHHFLGLEVEKSDGHFLSQRSYATKL